MNISTTTQAVLLLTCQFSNDNDIDTKPLTNKEWGRFALWLKDKTIMPADLLTKDISNKLNGWHDNQITVERLSKLLNRGHALAFAMEKWQRTGLWVITRSDPQYPQRLKQKLKTNAPPVLFGYGAKQLLNNGGLAIIGSRNANDNDINYSKQLATKAASQAVTIISGGAKGIDQAAMLGAIEHGGPVIGVISDNLMAMATSLKWRKGLMNNHVVLISTFYPEQQFTPALAMQRNKYIYCLADSAVVVHSGQTGGTYHGATENLKNYWVPLWVKPTDDQQAANSQLVNQGGQWCSTDIQNLDISQIISIAHNSVNHNEQLKQPMEPLAQTLYQLFIDSVKQITREPKTFEQLQQQTQLEPAQLTLWLNKACEQDIIYKNASEQYQSSG